MNIVDRTLAFLTQRKRAYQLAFKSPAGQEVLADLYKFCRAQETTFHPDARVSDALVGRRDVWLRIANHLNMTPEQLFEVSNRGIVPQQGD